MCFDIVEVRVGVGHPRNRLTLRGTRFGLAMNVPVGTGRLGGDARLLGGKVLCGLLVGRLWAARKAVVVVVVWHVGFTSGWKAGSSEHCAR